MTEKELHYFLKKNYPKENERCEWKSFRSLKNAFASWESGDIISYTSAISNMEGGHLLVGVNDTLEVTGIEDLYHYTPENTPSRIINKCPNLPSEGLWVESFTTTDTNKTVWIIHIPKHAPRKPVYAHGKTWQRIGDCLVLMTTEREHTILNEFLYQSDDWSAGIIEGASISDLDVTALKEAREKFRVKHPHLTDEMMSWDDITFLNKVKLTIKNKITRACILLLGKPDSEYFIYPALARISWILRDANNIEKDYQHFSCPFLLTVEDAFNKIRNLKYRYIKDHTLFPEEIDQYEPFVIREALHNCVAHQDYLQIGKINVIENEDGHLVFTNVGAFIPGSVDRVVIQDIPPDQYRNPFLVQAMVNLNMIDSIGSGIKRMFILQKRRFFPMPDFDISDNKVKVTITGKILDKSYATVLAQNPDLSLEDIILLDKVQKKKILTNEEVLHLKSKKLIEGRKPNFYISAKIAQATGQKATYTRYKALNNKYYQDLIIEAIRQHGFLSRQDLNDLLLEKLSDSLTPKQKVIKINNIISTMRKKGIIKNNGTDKTPVWVLSNTQSEGN